MKVRTPVIPPIEGGMLQRYIEGSTLYEGKNPPHASSRRRHVAEIYRWEFLPSYRVRLGSYGQILSLFSCKVS